MSINVSPELQQHINDVKSKVANALANEQEVEVAWAATQVISVATNTATQFDAVLQDNMGEFRARLKRVGAAVEVNFEGIGKRTMSVDKAKWEFDMMWKDLTAQGHEPLALR